MELRVATIKLEVITGLHIGGSDSMMKIGGVDSEVIKRSIKYDENGDISLVGKHTIDEPYIPGSSIKGKLRSLLEYKYNYHEVVRFVLDEIKSKKTSKNGGEFKRDIENDIKELENIKGEVTNFKRLNFLLKIIDDYKLTDKIQQKFKKFDKESFKKNIESFLVQLMILIT